MLDSLEMKIQNKLSGSDDILVFDSLRTAREYLNRFICKSPNEVISANRAIGLTELKRQGDQSCYKPVTLLDKYHFLYVFCHKEGNEDYVRQLVGRAIDYNHLVTILNNANGIIPLEDFPFKNERIKEALIHLRDEYSEYLKREGKSDSSYDDFKDFSSDQKYTFIVPESSIDMQKFIKKAEMKFDEINLDSYDGYEIHFYSNERVEIRHVLKDVINRLEKGTNKASDIIITVADLKRNQKYIEKEAEAIGLKLVYNQEIPFRMTPNGMLLAGLVEFMHSGSWTSVHNLSLLPSLGNVAMKRLQRISMMMIDLRGDDIHSFGKKLQGYKQNENKEGLLDAIRKDVDFLDKVVRKKKLSEVWDSFINYFQISNDDTSGEEDALDIIKCADEYMNADYQALSALINAMTCREANNERGIKVFEYGTDILYPAKLRYIIGLSDQTMSVRYTDYGFLSDYQKTENGMVIDTSEALLRSYSEASSELQISGSSMCFGVVHSIPMFFYNQGNSIIREIGDAAGDYEYDELMQEYTEGPETLWKGVDFCDGNAGFISGSNIDNAKKCLLRVKLENQPSLRYSRSRWNPSDKDSITEGSIMHSVIRKYIETYYISNPTYNKEYFASLLEKECEYAGYTKRDAAFFMKKYNEGLKGLFYLLKYEIGAETIACEVVINKGGYPFLKDSRADLIINTHEAQEVILDIKTGDVDKKSKSLQLLLYSMLASQNQDDSKMNILFSLRDNKSVPGECDYKKLYELLCKINEDIENYDWTPKDGVDCQYCQMSGICRRGYLA